MSNLVGPNVIRARGFRQILLSQNAVRAEPAISASRKPPQQVRCHPRTGTAPALDRFGGRPLGRGKSNAALLCGRHHTIVNRDGLTATLTTGISTGKSMSNPEDRETSPRVVWDRRPGSYDHALARGPSAGGPDP